MKERKKLIEEIRKASLVLSLDSKEGKDTKNLEVFLKHLVSKL